MQIQVKMPTENGLRVHAVTAVLFVQFVLKDQISFVMNAPALIHYESPLAGHSLQISGDMEYRQTQPIYRFVEASKGNLSFPHHLSTEPIATRTTLQIQRYQILLVLTLIFI